MDKNDLMKRVGVLLFIMSIGFPLRAQWFDSQIKNIDEAKLKVKYELSYREDTTELQTVKTETMLLLIGNKVNSFQSYNSYKFLQVGRKKREEGLLDEWIESGSVMSYRSRFTYCIYKNYPNGKITTLDDLLFSDRFQYEEPMKQFEWEIFDDSATIEGYFCQRAKCEFGGRVWEAWFTGELPFNEGPYKFCGLPGLILNISDTDNHYSFKFISIEPAEEEDAIIWEEEYYIKTTKKGFYEAQKHNAETIGDSDDFDEKTAKRIQMALRSHNNPIELDSK